MPKATCDVIDKLSALPPFPKAATKLLRLLEDQSVSIEQLAAVISSDPSLAMKVIHVANSPFYMCSRRIDSIKDAVLVLGMNTIKGLTTALSVHQGISRIRPSTPTFDILGFWKHSYATALASSRVVSPEFRSYKERLYLAGLIHDVGKLIQAFYWPDSWTACVNIIRSEDVSYETAEAQVFARTHHELADTVCRNWQFPDDMVNLLVDLATGPPAEEVTGDSPLSSLSIAHQISLHLGLCCPQEESVQVSTAAAGEAERLSDDLRTEIDYQLQILDH